MISSFTGQYDFLSNFYRSPVEFEGHLYRSVEHAYQAAKTLDEDMRKKIRDTEKPGKAKRIGKSLRLRPDWEKIKFDIMRQLLKDKFTNDILRARLLTTGTQELIEGNNWHDKIWGECICEKCGGEGENNLGKLLMGLREELRNANDNDNDLTETTGMTKDE